MLVSIIVPCYNQAHLIEETLTSIISQTYKDWECIIINDGSSDNICDVANVWVSRDTRFSYYEKENGGLSSARNEGLTHAKGTLVLPLDSDDKISPAYLQLAVEAFENNPNIVLVYGRAEYFDAKTGEWLLPVYKYEKLLLQNQVYCSAIFRLKDAVVIDGYDEALKSGFEDWEFWIRLLDANSLVVKIPEVVFYYRKKIKLHAGCFKQTKKCFAHSRGIYFQEAY